MEEGDLRDLETIFAQVKDPRIERPKEHRLRAIIILEMCGILCGAEGWVEIEAFGKAKEAWFTDLLKNPHGIPSHDTFGRVFARIDPKQCEASFFQWVRGISQTVKGVIAIDGKAPRCSHDHASLEESAPFGERVGSGKPLRIGSNRHGRESERDHSSSDPFAAMSSGWLYCHQ